MNIHHVSYVAIHQTFNRFINLTNKRFFPLNLNKDARITDVELGGIEAGV